MIKFNDYIVLPSLVSSASAQTTPVATPTLITPQQLAANPSLMSVVDPSVSAQLLAAGKGFQQLQNNVYVTTFTILMMLLRY